MLNVHANKCEGAGLSCRAEAFTKLDVYNLTYACLIVLVLWLGLSLQCADAATIVVTSAQDQPDPLRITLREAVEQAQSGDTIVFDQALTGSTIVLSPVLGPLRLDQSVTISGGGRSITVSGGGATNHVRCDPNPKQFATIVIEELSFVNGRSFIGASLVANRATLDLTVRGCRFRGNHSDSAGGAVMLNVGRTLIVNCIFEENSAQQLGGALNCSSGTTVRNCTFINNLAGVSGGAAVISATTMENCELRGNRAGQSGAIDASQQVTLRNLNVHGNNAQFSASAISLSGSTRMIDCRVHGNEGGTYAVSIRGPGSEGVVELIDCSVYANPDGSGITTTGVNPGPVRLIRCTVRDHRWSGIDLGGLQTTVISDSTVENNGFGISKYESNLELHRCTIKSNGTGITISKGDTRIVDSSVVNNRFIGINIGSNEARRTTIEGCTVSGNVSSGALGGGIYSRGQEVTIDRSTISGNRVSGSGGGVVYVNDGANRLTIASSTITSNHAGGRGGGVYIVPGQAGPVTVSNTIISGNSDGANMEPDCVGSFLSSGFNLIGIIDGSDGWVADDLTGDISEPIYARLASLADNGGVTFTHALLSDSPARNTGDASLINARDQRGARRDAYPDRGSFEHGAVPRPRPVPPSEIISTPFP